MQLTEGKPTPTRPFIGSDPLYNAVLNVAIRREDIDVVSVSIIKALLAPFSFNKFLNWTNTLAVIAIPVLLTHRALSSCCGGPPMALPGFGAFKW